HLALIGLTLALIGAARLGLFLIAEIGGFAHDFNQSFLFVGADRLGTNAAHVVLGLAALSDGYFFGRTLGTFSTVVALLHALGLIAILTAMVAALRRGLTSATGWNLRFVLA